jgi:hypothetical protein
MKLSMPVLGVLALALAPSAFALSPVCAAAANENKVSWPDATNPVWEMCWLRVSNSSGPRGSGLELRNIHFRGVPMVKRAHAPILFAEYRNGAGGNCYRDWKDENSALLAPVSVRNVLGTPTAAFSATTNCDVSNLATTSYGGCPFSQPGRTTADCAASGTVAIENLLVGSGFRLTTQYTAGWYKYTARYTFLANGDIDTQFGFGNSDGTYNNTTHWHQNYWRFDFDIAGAANDQINNGGVPYTTEFSGLRSNRDSYSVTDALGNFGYNIVTGVNDNTYPANESGRNFHLVDVIGTRYSATELSDRTTNNLSDCTMNANVLANGESIDKADVVLYYRASVRDSTGNDWPTPGAAAIAQDSMVCKSVGPMLQLTGQFPVPEGDFQFFKDGAE